MWSDEIYDVPLSSVPCFPSHLGREHEHEASGKKQTHVLAMGNESVTYF